MKIQFKTVSTPEEVWQMLDLQAENHVSKVNAETARAQGFVTVKHEPAVLLRMNQVAPSIVAKDDNHVVGYALVMPREFVADIPILQPMFDLLDTLSWKGTALRDNPRWLAMGQICVADGYRGQGVFDGLYAKMRETCRRDYDLVITEIAERNARSIRAHERVGFQTLHTFSDEVAKEDWRVVIWDLA